MFHLPASLGFKHIFSHFLILFWLIVVCFHSLQSNKAAAHAEINVASSGVVPASFHNFAYAGEYPLGSHTKISLTSGRSFSNIRLSLNVQK